VATAGDLLVNIGADIKDFKKGISGMQDSMKNAGKEMQKIGTSMSTKVTAPLIGIATGVVMTASKFETSMNKVRAISGATGDDFTNLRDLAKDLGATTRFSASEAADGMSFLAMAGYETNDIIASMPGLLDLAAAGQLELASAADITSNIISGFNMEAEESTRVADVLASVASKSNTNVQQMGEAMKYAAPVASALGLGVEETAAAIGFMSDAGIQGTQAGTSLRAGLSALAKPSSQAASLMENLGIEMFDSEGNMKSFADMTKELEKGTADLTNEQKTNAFATIFGREAMSGWLAIVGRGGEEFKDFNDMLVNSSGSAKEMAEIMGGGFSGTLKTLQSALEGVAIEFGDILLPILTAVTDKIIGAVRWFSGLSKETKTVITIVAALVGAVGPLLVVMGTLMTVLGSLSAPIVLVVAAVAGLIGVFSTGMVKSEAFRDAVSSGFERIKTVVSEVFLRVKEVILQALVYVQELWNEYGEGIVETVTTLFNGIWQIISDVFWRIYESIKEVLDIIMPLIEETVLMLLEFWDNHGQQLVESFLQVFNSLKETVMTIFNAVKDVIVTVLELVLPFVKEKLNALLEFWAQNGEQIMSAVTNAFNIIKGIIKVVMAVVIAVIKSAWTSIKKIIDGALKIIKGIVKVFTGIFTMDFKMLWSGIKDIFSGALEFIWGLIRSIFLGHLINIFNALKSKASEIFNNMWSSVKGIFNGLKDSVSNTVSNLLSSVTNTFSKIVNALFNPVKQGSDKVKGVFKGMLNFVKNLGSSFLNAGKGLIGQMVKGITGAASKAVNAVKGVAKKIRNFLPFSPAKEGPLSDLDRLDFGGPMEDSMHRQEKDVQRSLAQMLELPEQNYSLAFADAGDMDAKSLTSTSFGNYPKDLTYSGQDEDDDNTVYEFTIPVTMDKKEVGKATAKFSKKELDRQKRTKDKLKGRD